MPRDHSEIDPTLIEMTWEEKHPTDYLSGPSDEDLEWLESKIRCDEENISSKSIREPRKESEK